MEGGFEHQPPVARTYDDESLFSQNKGSAMTSVRNSSICSGVVTAPHFEWPPPLAEAVTAKETEVLHSSPEETKAKSARRSY